MADFKQVVELLEDNDKTAMYMNNVRGFSKKNGRDEVTVAVENGWGQKLITGSAVCVVLVVDRDEWARVCDVIDSKNSDSTESPSEAAAVKGVPMNNRLDCGCVKGYYWCSKHDIYAKRDVNDPPHRVRDIEIVKSEECTCHISAPCSFCEGGGSYE